MRLILDTNVLLSASITDSATRRIIVQSGFDFYYPRDSLEELMAHRDLVSRKSGLCHSKVDDLLAGLLACMELVPTELFVRDFPEAERVMRGVDPDDAIFVACALAVPNSAVWSNDRHMKMQKLVKVYTTEEILGLL